MGKVKVHPVFGYAEYKLVKFYLKWMGYLHN